MRPLLPAVLALTFLVTAATCPALSLTDGKVVRGRYDLNGYAKAIGFRATYGPGTIRVTINGRVRGKVLRTVLFGGFVQQSYVRVSGNIHSLRVRARKGTFIGPMSVRVGGNTFKGEITGLTDQKPTRFFRGKLKGARKSNLSLRSHQ
jgi:hypothetical protein